MTDSSNQLAVVFISIARHRPGLALGNIIGSTISNILGAFSLGLLFWKGSDAVVFDRSLKLYSILLLA
jgi:Ca2+/Na+ antiporter